MEGPGDSEITRQIDLSNTLSSGVQVLAGAISIYVGEEVRRFGEVVKSDRDDPLTVMGDIYGIAWKKGGESAGVSGTSNASIDDGEGVPGGGVQDSTGVVREFEGLATSTDSQVGGSGNGDRADGKDGEGNTEGRGEHYNEGPNGRW